MRKHRILLVDDEVALTRLLKLNLEHTGRYEVCAENAGKRALDTARQFRPDLVLCDVVMPDIGGGDVAAQLREDPRLADVPLVFLTAIVSKEEADKRGGTIGGHPFLAKPVAMEDLLACIERHLPSNGEET